MTDLTQERDAVEAADPSVAWAGIRVIDLSEHRAGQFAARLMADAGADVLLIEPVAGSSLRRTGPFWSDGRRPEDSITFWHLNSGKRSVTMDLSQRTGRRLLTDLFQSADVAVASRGIPDGLIPDEIWTCWVDDFAEPSPFSSWQGSELIHQAMSDVMYESGAAIEQPLYGCGNRSYAATGTAAYIATAAALFDKGRLGKAPDAAVNVSEVAPAMNHCAGTHYWYNSTFDVRGDQISPTMMLHCADGWVVIFPSAPRWAGTCRALGAPDLADDPRYNTEELRLPQWPAIRAELQAACGSLLRDDVIAAADRENVIVTRVANPHELWEDEHLVARRFWQTVTDGEQPRPALSPSFRSAGQSRATYRRAPLLGEHTREVLATIGISEDDYDFLRNIGTV